MSWRVFARYTVAGTDQDAAPADGNNASTVAGPSVPLRIATAVAAVTYMVVRGVYKTRVDTSTAGDKINEMAESQPQFLVRQLRRSLFLLLFDIILFPARALALPSFGGGRLQPGLLRAAGVRQQG